jgi:2,4-dienoyl-CoA reductase-like NADH-dependent reductase (Old Yellow Enzyme family)/thioredoxin reductase
MAQKNWKLFEPITIGKLTIKNRIYMPSMCTNYAGPSGESTIRDVGHYETKARGGAGLITVDYSLVSPEGRGTTGQRGLWKDEFMPHFSRIVDTIKTYGARASTQLHHAGANAAVAEPVAPSPIGNREFFITNPRELTTEEAEQLVTKFAQAALRAKDAGVDMVEVHGASGYLVCQFISPLFNFRTDKYGQDKLLFATEIVQRIKEKCGIDFPVAFRMDSDQIYPGGITLDYAKEVARRLEAAGVDLLNVIGGTPDTEDYTEPNMYIEDDEGDFYRFIKNAAELKKVVSVPIVSGGLIADPLTAENALEEGMVDMVFVGRQLLADPEWPNKARNGRIEDIRPCTACNDGCVGRVFLNQTVWCTVNPLSGNEYRWPTDDALPKAVNPKKVLIIGAGPAGLEAARISAIRGHEVTVLEQNREVGGTTNIYTTLSFKKRWRKLIQWYHHQLQKLDVEIKLHTKATPALIKKLAPDTLIMATGSSPLIPRIPGIDKALIVDHVLTGNTPVGKTVVIIGGGNVGLDTAIYLSKKDKKVTVVEALPEVGSDLEPTAKLTFFRKSSGLLDRYQITILTNSPVIEVLDRGVEIVDSVGGRRLISCESVICAVGRKPILLKELEDGIRDVHVIGDAKAPRKIIDAIHEGFMTALVI